MTKLKIIIGSSLFAVIALGLIIGFVIVPSFTKKEEPNEESAKTSSESSVLKYESDNPISAKLILNSEKKWTQSESPFEIRNLEYIIVTPETYATELNTGRRIIINGITHDITELTDSAMTIQKTQLTVSEIN